MHLIKIYGQKSFNTEYVYKSSDEKNICRISVSKSCSMQNVEIEGLGLKFVSDFDIETTLVPGIKRSIFNEGKKIGHLEYFGGKKLKLMCEEITFDVFISSVSYDFYKDKNKIAVINRFWREAAPLSELDKLSVFSVEVIENLSNEELLFILAMPILRFDFSINELDCIV